MDFTNPIDETAVDLNIGNSSVKVSKGIMRYIPYFNRLFSKEWETQEYSLSEDDPFALKILLAIVHFKGRFLPSSISLTQLYGLALVCDKYDTKDLILHYAESLGWISALWKDGKPRPERGTRSWASWLWICHVFKTNKKKDSERYERVLDVLAANMGELDKVWYVEGRKVSTIQCPSILHPLQGKY